jgi:hypothetical protein
LNRCAGKLTVLLDWVDPEHRLTFRLVKDGKEIDIRYKITEGHTYRIATIYFPHYQTESGYMHTMTTHTVSQVPQELPSLLQDKLLVTSGEYIDPEGRWELIVRRQSPSDSTPVAYHVAVLVEDKIMEIIPERHPNVWYTGDPIPIEFQLREGRKPISEVYTASATISSPVTSFANLLYKFQGRSGISGQIMRLLANSQAITGSLAKREEVIMPLQPKKVDKKNRVTQYSGTYERATVPGIYNLRLKVRGISAKCGMFERVENMSFVVKAKPDPSASSIKIIYDRAGNRLSVLIVPKDKYGNIVGPGYSRLLRYTHGGEPAGEIIDNLDGSYRVDIPKVKPADLDKVSVAVEMSNVVLFRGNPGKLVEKNLKK